MKNKCIYYINTQECIMHKRCIFLTTENECRLNGDLTTYNTAEYKPDNQPDKFLINDIFTRSMS